MVTTHTSKVPQEVEDLMDKGISGSGVGFDAPSVGRLGGRGPVPVHNPDPRKLRDVAVKVLYGIPLLSLSCSRTYQAG